MTRLARSLLALLVLAVALPATAQVTDEDIDRARSEVNEIMAEAQALGDEVQDAWSRQFALDREITDLNASIELARVKIVDTEKKLEEVAVEMYMGSSTATSMQILFSSSDESYGAGVEYLRNVTGNDADVINQLRSFRVELDRQTGRLEEASAEQEILTGELEEKAGNLQGQLVEAQAVYDGLVERQAAEEAARRAAEEEARRRERPRRLRATRPRRQRRARRTTPKTTQKNRRRRPRRPRRRPTRLHLRNRHHHRHRAGELVRWPAPCHSPTPGAIPGRGAAPIRAWT